MGLRSASSAINEVSEIIDIDIPTKGNDYRYLIPGKNFWSKYALNNQKYQRLISLG